MLSGIPSLVPQLAPLDRLGDGQQVAKVVVLRERPSCVLRGVRRPFPSLGKLDHGRIPGCFVHPRSWVENYSPRGFVVILVDPDRMLVIPADEVWLRHGPKVARPRRSNGARFSKRSYGTRLFRASPLRLEVTGNTGGHGKVHKGGIRPDCAPGPSASTGRELSLAEHRIRNARVSGSILEGGSRFGERAIRC